MKSFDRRRVLKGMLAGSAVTVGLPLLNCFLNTNGTALADGAPIPIRFGTWFWGLGMNKNIFVPKKTGADYDLPEELLPIKDVQQHVNVFTNYDVYRDSNPSFCHYTGWVGMRTGSVPKARGDLPAPSIDVIVAQKIGGATRFPLLNANATGDLHDTYSFQGPNAINSPEISPIDFYTRVFGPDFQDPNAASFTPNPRLMAQKSVLSGVLSESKDLGRTLGSEDRARMDHYFTAVRDLERQLSHQLEKPQPIASCHAPKAPTDDIPVGLQYERVAARHKLMTDILVMAVLCDQTRVVNLAYSNAGASTTRDGFPKGHHITTHEEPLDPVLGYQPQASWFTRKALESWAYFVDAFAKVPEGGGTLLDNMLIYAHTDQSFAKIHSTDGLPMFSAGRAGGRIKTGMHIDGTHTPGTQLGYTLMRTLGVDIDSWGTLSNKTSKEIGEIVA